MRSEKPRKPKTGLLIAVLLVLGALQIAAGTFMLLGVRRAMDQGTLPDVLDEMERCGRLELEKKRAEILQTACKHAIKGGEALTEDQLRSILDEMLEKKVTPTCPHGRPLVVAITHRELDRKFKRIQT